MHTNAVRPDPFPSASYAAGTWYGAGPSQTSPTTTAAARKPAKNDAWVGISVVIDVTDVGAAGTVTVKLQGFDALSGKWFDVPGAATAAIAATGTSTLLVIPGTAETANVRVSELVPTLYQLVATVAGNAVAFSASAKLVRLG